jgi:hypothetical protein
VVENAIDVKFIWGSSHRDIAVYEDGRLSGDDFREFSRVIRGNALHDAANGGE